MIQRRGFLAGILAAASAPALVRAGFLMPVKQIALPDRRPLLPGDSFQFYASEPIYEWRINGILLQSGKSMTFTPDRPGSVTVCERWISS